MENSWEEIARGVDEKLRQERAVADAAATAAANERARQLDNAKRVEVMIGEINGQVNRFLSLMASARNPGAIPSLTRAAFRRINEASRGESQRSLDRFFWKNATLGWPLEENRPYLDIPDDSPQRTAYVSYFVDVKGRVERNPEINGESSRVMLRGRFPLPFAVEGSTQLTTEDIYFLVDALPLALVTLLRRNGVPVF